MSTIVFERDGVELPLTQKEVALYKCFPAGSMSFEMYRATALVKQVFTGARVIHLFLGCDRE